MNNTLGTVIKVTLFGESHGKYIGAVLDGLPAMIPVKEDDVAAALAYWDIRPGDRTPPPPEPVPGRGFRSDLARRDEGAARGGGAGGA